MGTRYYFIYLGIDRTVMMLTDHIRIQEVLLFPAMKPELDEPKKEAASEEKVEVVSQQKV